MSSKAEKEKQKLIQEKCQTILNELLRDEDNKYCVDCDAKGPRWASWNLGIFLCIRCAGIHRNLGVHISKVKSVNLDTWTPEQVVSLQQMGNSRARAVYEANLPDSFRRPQHDSSLEAFIRSKYEQKKYIAKEWVPPVIGKVNWDREIEESRKKKEGKRKVTSGISLPAPELHAIPKPKSPSGTPKPVRAAATIAALESAEAEKKSAAAAANTTSSAIDLLGLDAPTTAGQSGGDDDIFTSFLSAPPAAEASLSSNTVSDEASGGKRSAEEDSFFNQPASNVQDKKPLTKDSIMALYSQAGSQPAQQNIFGLQASPGMFAQPGFQAAQPMQNMGFAAAPAAVPNGMLGGVGVPTGVAPCMTGMPQNGMFTGGVPNMGMVSNPFFATGMPASTGSAGFQGMPGMMQAHAQPSAAASPDSQDLMLDFAALAKPSQTSASLPANAQQLPQQMGRMNLGGAPTGAGGLMGGVPNTFGQPPNVGHTLSTNLWQ